MGLSSGLTPGELSTLRKTYERLEMEVERLAGEYHRVPVTTGPDAERIKETLKSTVAKAFKARQQLQRGELATFRRRLDAIEEQIENRYRRESEIITRRVDELLDPNLKWDAVDARGPAVRQNNR
jgi:predicted  nucleic acid-binding Zn-ribbon protein